MIIIKNLYINQQVRFCHEKGYIVAVLPSGKPKPIIDVHMKVLEYINKTSSYEEICSYINCLEPDIDPEKLLATLIRDDILLEEKPVFQWMGSTFGASLIDKAEENAVLNVVRSRKLYRYENISILGYNNQPRSYLDSFEEEMKKMLTSKYFLAVSSGTCALDALLDAYNIKQGDEVIIPSFGYIGIVSILVRRNVIPVICDIDEELMLSPADVEQCISEKTKAIICMHYRGRAAKINQLVAIAKKHSVLLIEDCAQAVGTSLDGKRLGTYGDAGYFSFHQHKLITCGEGGGICVNDPVIYEKLQLITDASRLFAHRNLLPGIPGSNYRMSELHAALGCVQLTRLNGMINKLMTLYNILASKLDGLASLKIIKLQDGEFGGVQSFCLQIKNKQIMDDLAKYLNHMGVNADVLYYDESTHHDIYLNWAYAMEYMGAVNKWKDERACLEKLYPHSLDILKHTIVIPLGVGIDESTVDLLADGILEFLKGFS